MKISVLACLINLTLLSSTFFSQVSQEWVRKYNGPGANRIEIATSIAVDASGNVYVTGQSQVYKNNYDYVTIKYNTSGVQQWLARYNGPGDTTDYGAAITVDNQGNVYVTGFSAGSGTGYDFLTVKYNSSGTELWTARYNGPGNYNDAGRFIAVDDSGNVYVTGESWGGSSNYDFATVKYNSNGAQQWAARYNGTGNYVDQAASLDVDPSGNVYVTGYTISGLSNYLTIKYNPAGVQQWTAIYNGTGNGSDEARSIKVDSAGTSYITGRSFQSGTTYDYTTIKYNTSGDSIWVARYNGPANGSDEASAIEIDRFGNVYVTGNSTGQLQDAATIKYNSNGVQQWAQRYDGGSYEYGLSIAVDTAMNVYVTGFKGLSHTEDYLTLKYNYNGVQQWANLYDGPGNDRDEARGVAVDNAGNSYVTGFSYKGILGGLSDYATIKYNSSGAQQWVQRYNGPVRSTDLFTAITSDSAGNIYLTGQSEGDGSGMDVVTMKYNPNGDSVWIRRFNAPANSNDIPIAISVDNAGNVFITGNSWEDGEFQSAQIMTIKYNSAGVLQWFSIYPGVGYACSGTSAASDNAGNVYVCGIYRFSNIPLAADYITIKYNSTGDSVWSKRYNGGGLDEPKKILLDQQGFVYVTGRSNGPNNLDFLTLKYNTSGDSLWSARFNGVGSNWDEPNDMAIDYSGNLYIAGFSRSSSTSGSEDYAALKYNSSGVLQWSRYYNGTGNNYDASTSISVDTLNNLYVTGFSFQTGGSYDYVTIKYGHEGDTIWIKSYNSPANGTDKATSIKVDRSLNSFVTGGVKLGSGYNLGTLKYNSQGLLQWNYQYTANSDSNYMNPQLALDNAGGVYIAASSFENSTDYDIVLIKLSESIGIKTLSNDIPDKFELLQNYPNPFNPVTHFQFRVASFGPVSLSVYDILGREIKQLVNKELKPGTYEVEWNAVSYPSGVYFYRLIAGKPSAQIRFTKKMILIK